LKKPNFQKVLKLLEATFGKIEIIEEFDGIPEEDT
jgi:hypothetical protein